MSTCYNVSDAWPFSVYNKCNFRILYCDVGVNAFWSPSGVPHPNIFRFFFSKLVDILVCFILKMKKKSFCPRERLQHCSFAYRKESRLSMSKHKPSWQKLMALHFSICRTYGVSGNLSKVSWVTSRLYYIRPCAVLIE